MFNRALADRRQMHIYQRQTDYGSKWVQLTLCTKSPLYTIITGLYMTI